MASRLSIENLLPQAGMSTYRLVRMASKRALELSDGKPTLLEKVETDKLTTIALEEILKKKVLYKETADQFPQEDAV